MENNIHEQIDLFDFSAGGHCQFYQEFFVCNGLKYPISQYRARVCGPNNCTDENEANNGISNTGVNKDIT